MERNKLLGADYLDILFDGRNKKYGGYELRRRYALRARKACIAVLLGAAFGAAIPVIASSLAGSEPVNVPMDKPTSLAPIHLPEKSPEIPVHIPAPPPPPAPTIRNPEPKIEPDERVTEKPPTVDEIRTKQVSLETTAGDSTGLVPNTAARTGDGTRAVEMPSHGDDQPLRMVDQFPAFNGDLADYLRRNLKYPESARTSGVDGRVGIQFVVDKDGSIIDVEVYRKAAPALDAEALRVVRNMPKWKPGMMNGKPVKTYFTLPISFTLD